MSESMKSGEVTSIILMKPFDYFDSIFIKTNERFTETITSFCKRVLGFAL